MPANFRQDCTLTAEEIQRKLFLSSSEVGNSLVGTQREPHII